MLHRFKMKSEVSSKSGAGGSGGDEDVPETASQSPEDVGRVTCTACEAEVNTKISGTAWSAKIHPDLNVLICQKCYKLISSEPIPKGEDESDEECRWCRAVGKKYFCNFCPNAFCKFCIQRNIGRSEQSNVVKQEQQHQWKCYMCNPEPLTSLRSECKKVMEYVKIMEENAKQRKVDAKKKKETLTLSANKSNSKTAGGKQLALRTKGNRAQHRLRVQYRRSKFQRNDEKLVNCCFYIVDK